MAMARNRRRETHATAFVVGALLAGAAAAAYPMWHAPVSGATTRRRLMERLEGTVFTALGAAEATTARVLTPERPVPLAATVADDDNVVTAGA
jgi:hypothetical protein